MKAKLSRSANPRAVSDGWRKTNNLKFYLHTRRSVVSPLNLDRNSIESFPPVNETSVPSCQMWATNFVLELDNWNNPVVWPAGQMDEEFDSRIPFEFAKVRCKSVSPTRAMKSSLKDCHLTLRLATQRLRLGYSPLPFWHVSLAWKLIAKSV